jgi:phage terminase large subunit-like protein
MDLQKAINLSNEEIIALPVEMRRRILEDAQMQLRESRTAIQQPHQLELYEPASEEAKKIHLSMAKEIIAVGGNRSSKTETMLVDTIIQMTGIVPNCLRDVYPKKKLHLGPIKVRLVCTSLVTTWDEVIKPKLQYWRWSGRGEPGGGNGHWGWIPPHMLIDGKWEKSWSEKHRIITLSNGSTLQVMSYDQEVSQFAGGTFHVINHDEGPPWGIYRENKMRTLDTAGRLYIAMTPPDDESASWDAAWVYDELYEKGLVGPNKDPQIDSFTLMTEQNRILDAQSIADIAKGLTRAQQEVRLRGRFLHLSGRIYSMYTDRMQKWCFGCNDVIIAMDKDDMLQKRCVVCGSLEVVEFCHFIQPLEKAFTWPVVMVLDPHPRKPHAIAWYAINPSDDPWQIAEMEIDDSPAMVKKAVWDMEERLQIQVYKRLIDPNMGESPSSSAKAGGGRTVRDEFDAVGLRCVLADDNRETARMTLREMMKPDKKTGTPRFKIFNTCRRSNWQFLRYSWDEWSRYSTDKKDPKPRPREKEDDFPTLAGYMVNDNLTFRGLREGNQPIKRKELMQRRSGGIENYGNTAKKIFGNR